MRGWGLEEAVLESAEQAEPGRSRPGPCCPARRVACSPFPSCLPGDELCVHPRNEAVMATLPLSSQVLPRLQSPEPPDSLLPPPMPCLPSPEAPLRACLTCLHLGEYPVSTLSFRPLTVRLLVAPSPIWTHCLSAETLALLLLLGHMLSL